MALRIILTGALLVVNLGHAVPAMAGELSANNYLIFCDVNGYTYINEGSGGSPLIDDCKELVANIQKDGTWTWMEDGQHQLAQKDSCAFGVEPGTSESAEIVLTGNGDITTVINEAIKRFGANGRVGASGYMWCTKKTGGINGEYAKVKFGIYHD